MNPFDELNGRFDQRRLAQFMQMQQQAPVGPVVAPQPQKKKKSFLLDQVSTLGGIVGGIGGSFIAPVAGTAGGAALGSALGEALENKLSGESLGKNVLKEAALGGIFSVGPTKLLKAGYGAAKGGQVAAQAGGKLASSLAAKEVASEGAEQVLKTSTQGKLTELGNKALASQYGTISKPVARQTNPLKTISTLADVGITKPVDAERMAKAITGSDGIITKKVMDSVGGATKVSTKGVSDVLESSMANIGIVDSDAKALRSIVTAKLGALGEGDADPKKVIKVMRDLESRVADLKGQGGNYKLMDPRRSDMAQALQNVRDDLEDRLFTTAGANANVAKVMTPEVRGQLVGLMPGNKKWMRYVDSTLMKSPGVKELRSAMAPFVRIGKIIDEGDVNAMTFGGRVSNFVQGSGGLSNILLGGAMQVGKNPAARAAGGALRFAGSEAGQNIAMRSGVAARLGGQAASSGVYNALKPGEASADPLQDALAAGGAPAPSPYPQTPQMGGMASGMPVGAGMGDAASDVGSPYTRQNLLKDIQRDPDNADKYMEYYQQLDSIYNPKVTGASSKPNATQVQQSNNAMSGLQDLDLLRQMVTKDPSIATKASVPGGNLARRITGTTQFEAAKQNVADVIGRLRSGGAINSDEAVRFLNQLPKAGDSQQDALLKIDRVTNLLMSFAQPQEAEPENMMLSQALGR